MKIIIALFVLMLSIPSLACAEDQFDIRQFVTDHYFNSDPARHQRAIEKGAALYCDPYVIIDQNVVIDDGGPAYISDATIYYLNVKDGSVFSECGGSCMGGKNPEF